MKKGFDLVPVTHETFKLLFEDHDPDNLLVFVDNYLDKHGLKWCYPHNEDAANYRFDFHEYGYNQKWNLEELNKACGI